MDWKECQNMGIVKRVDQNKSKINSIREISKKKRESAEYLPKDHSISKITLLYDALRELLEAKAIEKGYKIYNHECYHAFLKEILGMSREGDLFNSLRKIRNGINYYGKKVNHEESKEIINDLNYLISVFES